MRILLGRLILVLLMAWLPLQGAFAAAVHACPHNGNQPQAVMTHHDGHDQTAPQKDGQHPAECHLVSGGCASSHGCSGNVAILTSFPASSPDPVSHSETIFLESFSLFIPEQPQRPPRA